MTVARPFRYTGHAVVHAGEPCTCPDDWPRDLTPGACLPCYREGPPNGGLDRPAYQCQTHAQHADITGRDP